MDIVGVEHASQLNEPNMIDISFGFGMTYLFIVKRLVWEHPNYDQRFSYFRLKFDNAPLIFPEAVQELEKWKTEIELFKDIETVKESSEDLNVNAKGEYEPYNPEDPSAQVRWQAFLF